MGNCLTVYEGPLRVNISTASDVILQLVFEQLTMVPCWRVLIEFSILSMQEILFPKNYYYKFFLEIGSRMKNGDSCRRMTCQSVGFHRHKDACPWTWKRVVNQRVSSHGHEE